MFGSNYARAVFLIALALSALIARPAVAQNTTSLPQNTTSVHLHWGQQKNVSRYRLQLAQDSSFADIVFDRVITGTEIDINDLDPGRYFWRIAPLTSNLGEFSAAGVIDVKRTSATASASPSPFNQPLHSNQIVTGGGWRAALGEVGSSTTAHLRSPDRLDLVAMNAGGVLFALDSGSGVVLWTRRTPSQANNRAFANSLIIVPAHARLDNLVLLSGALIMAIEGTTGRELWRSNLPAIGLSGAAISNRTGGCLVILDVSRQRLFIVSDGNGELVSQVKLPARAVGAPVPLAGQSEAAFALAYDTGDIELRDAAGNIVRSANVSSTATTAPLFIAGPRGNLLLLGTRDGLTAITADDLRPLGRVAIQNDAPRGTLLAQDLNGDGVAEVIMTTERRHLIAVNATNGKIIWDVPANDFGEALAFADINGDRVLDVFVSGNDRLATALSGVDGSVIWKDDEPPGVATNHATTSETRHLMAVPSNSGFLLIGSEPTHTGLRAIAFPNTQLRPK